MELLVFQSVPAAPCSVAGQHQKSVAQLTQHPLFTYFKALTRSTLSPLLSRQRGVAELQSFSTGAASECWWALRRTRIWRWDASRGCTFPAKRLPVLLPWDRRQQTGRHRERRPPWKCAHAQTQHIFRCCTRLVAGRSCADPCAHAPPVFRCRAVPSAGCDVIFLLRTRISPLPFPALLTSRSSAAGRARSSMFRIEGLGPKMDPEELRRKMRRDVLTSVRNFLIYVALLRITPFILKKLDSV
uniref:Mitochondrial import receptor subunit TOM5 homolog n=2 Tax=Galliformes TaxID=8976 RepID=A0A8C9FN49_PAVCR